MKNKKIAVTISSLLFLSLVIFFKNAVNLDKKKEKKVKDQTVLESPSKNNTNDIDDKSRKLVNADTDNAEPFGPNVQNLKRTDTKLVKNKGDLNLPFDVKTMTKEEIEASILQDIYYYNDQQLLAVIHTINELALSTESIAFFIADIVQQQSFIEPENIDAFAKVLSYGNSETRAESITAEYVLDALSHIMYEIDEGYRPSVLEAMLSWQGVDTDARIEESVLGFLSSTSPDVAKSAVSALGKINSDSSENKLYELAYNENLTMELRREAWRTISQKGMTEEMEHYYRQFKEENP